jgi:hypothetical protein
MVGALVGASGYCPFPIRPRGQALAGGASLLGLVGMLAPQGQSLGLVVAHKLSAAFTFDNGHEVSESVWLGFVRAYVSGHRAKLFACQRAAMRALLGGGAHALGTSASVHCASTAKSSARV